MAQLHVLYAAIQLADIKAGTSKNIYKFASETHPKLKSHETVCILNAAVSDKLLCFKRNLYRTLDSPRGCDGRLPRCRKGKKKVCKKRSQTPFRKKCPKPACQTTASVGNACEEKKEEPCLLTINDGKNVETCKKKKKRPAGSSSICNPKKKCPKLTLGHDEPCECSSEDHDQDLDQDHCQDQDQDQVEMQE